MNEQEIWKDITDFEGLYQVSNFGRVRSCDKYEYIGNPHGTFTLRKKMGKIRVLHLNRYGYPICRLWKNNIAKTKTVHRLVAQSFIKNPDNKPEVNHLDRNKENNHVLNLVWATREENEKHRYTIGENGNVGAENNNAKPVINSKTGKIYGTIKEATEELNMGYDYTQAMLRGARKNCSPLKYVEQ